MTRKLLTNAFTRLDLQKKNLEKLIPGNLGITIRGEKTVELPNKPGYVYVRLRNNESEVIIAFNDAVSLTYDLPVLVYRDERDKTKYKIYGRNTGRYDNWGSSSAFLPRHGTTHSYSKDNPSGADVVWVYGDQFMPMIGIPSGTVGSMNIIIGQYNRYFNGYWQGIGNTGTADLSGYKPTGGFSRMVLVYMDVNGNPQLRESNDFFDVAITGSTAVLPFMPTLSANETPVCGVRLLSGTSALIWSNVYDVRSFFNQ